MNFEDQKDAEIERLQRWKTDATYVIGAWEEAWQSAGIHHNLGATKSEAMLDEITRLRAAGDALAEALEAVRDEHDACWCPDPRTEMAGTCELCAADEGWQEARRER